MGILKAAAVFSDGMVLQRGKPVRIWGMDRDGNTVTVTVRKVSPDAADAAAEEADCVRETADAADSVDTADAADSVEAAAAVIDHKWMAVLPPVREYGGPYEVTVTNGEDVLVFRDVWVGEVWLAGGQSNMELELKNCRTGTKELAQIARTGKQVRFYYTKKIAWMDEYFFEEERASHWETCESPDAGEWSAVGYYFAKELAGRLGCMVGVIGCNWGGTSASAWISRKWLEADADTASYVEEYDQAMAGKSFEDYLKDLADYREWERQWQPKIDEFYREHPCGTWDEAQAYAGESLWPEPLGPKSPFRPSGVYETMLMRVCPYTLAGFLYYQGESDEHKAGMYEKLFAMLIRQWRHDWMEPTLPFLCVQLPMFLEFGAPARFEWCRIREAQMRVQQQTSHMGIAVILDQGEYGNIHPVEKETVGVRLALQAMEKVYGPVDGAEANGPIFRCAYPYHQVMCVEFDYAQGMYVLDADGSHRTEGSVDFFELAGPDGKYVPAEAQLCEDGRVLVRAKGIGHPTYVRFQWVNYGEVTLFGRNGIPAAPFRTR